MWRNHAKKILPVLRSRRRYYEGSSRLPVASVAAVTLIYAEKKLLDREETVQFESSSLYRTGEVFQSLLPSNNTAACQASQVLEEPNSLGGGPRLFLRKRQTVELLEEHAEKGASLASKYKVQWSRPIGQGTYGEVFLATNRATQERFALKKINKQFTDQVNFQREMDALFKIRDAGGHPNICGMRENFDEGSHYQIILDLVSGGEMFDKLAEDGAYSEADAARLLREVTSALAFLHGIGLVHTDMKPENIMLSSKSTDQAAIKIVDFGCAHCADACDEAQHTPHGTAATPAYCPPEVLASLKTAKDKHPHICTSFDMWSLGVIAYIMLVGRHPFDLECNMTDVQLEEQILSGTKPPLRDSKYTKHLSQDAISVLEKLIEWDPAKRFTADELLDHPWIRGETASAKKIADSDRRLSVYREHEHSVMRSFFKGLLTHNDSSNSGGAAQQVKNSRRDTPNSLNKMSLLETAFRNLDPDGRGYISTKELQGDTSLFGSDAKLTMSEVSELLSERMTNRYFPKGSTVYEQGEEGNTMYFINSGSVTKSSRNGFEKKRNAGEFFGEDAMLVPNHKRIHSVHANTPLHAIEISRQDYEKYLKDDPAVQMIMAETIRLRSRENTKTIMGLEKTAESKVYKKDNVIFSAGEKGNALYILEEGTVEIFVKGHKVRSLRPGEMTGEHAAFYFDKPYNVTAVCKSDECKMQVIKDIHKVLKANHSLQESFQHIILYRDFKKVLVATIQKPFPTTDQELREAFDALDIKKEGFVSFEKLRTMVRNFDTNYSEDQIEAMLQTLDLNKSGSLTWEAFHRMYGDDKDM